jgi:hypothetical protein
VSLDLHTRLKTECSRRRLKIADVIHELLEREFPEAYKRNYDFTEEACEG